MEIASTIHVAEQMMFCTKNLVFNVSTYVSPIPHVVVVQQFRAYCKL